MILFDGSGAEFLARVERVERSVVRLTIIERREVDRELPCDVTLGVALPKGERQRWLVEKATELGVSRLVPLVTTRGVAQPTVETLRRLGRAVVEASKQCGRNRLMQIEEPLGWSDFVQGARDKGQSTRDGSARIRLFAHPGGARLSSRDDCAQRRCRVPSRRRSRRGLDRCRGAASAGRRLASGRFRQPHSCASRRRRSRWWRRLRCRFLANASGLVSFTTRP